MAGDKPTAEEATGKPEGTSNSAEGNAMMMSPEEMAAKCKEMKG